jgi:hypothetical protein
MTPVLQLSLTPNIKNSDQELISLLLKVCGFAVKSKAFIESAGDGTVFSFESARLAGVISPLRPSCASPTSLFFLGQFYPSAGWPKAESRMAEARAPFLFYG